MTNLQETIRSITAQFGESVLDDPLRLLGLLDDMGGFCWMIFPSIIIGGLLWIFNEAI